MLENQHFCILIIAQNQWKEKDFKQFGEGTLSDFLGNLEHSDCDICMTCPICRSFWELFDPENPGEYNLLCEYCEAFLEFFEKERIGDNVLLFTHTKIKSDALKKFAEYILENNKIKKIYILEHEDWSKRGRLPKPQKVIEQIKHQEVKQSEFISLIDENRYETLVMYEIFKDKYY